MTDKEKEILNTFAKVIPMMSEMDKEKLLSFAEGIVFATYRRVANEAVGNFL